MVYCGLFPSDGQDFEELRDALNRLSINDPSFEIEPETSEALRLGAAICDLCRKFGHLLHVTRGAEYACHLLGRHINLARAGATQKLGRHRTGDCSDRTPQLIKSHPHALQPILTDIH